MPCNDGGYRTTDYSDEYGRRLDCYAQMMCFMMTALDSLPAEEAARRIANNKQIAAWWEAHQEVDRRRKAAEEAEAARKKLKEELFKKLTPEELAALGVKKGN